MAQNNQPMFQTKPQEQFVQIPINIERDSITLMNQTGNSNRKPNHWPTIIISIIFVIVGQSIAKLLENFYYDKINRSEYDETRQNDGVWTQSLLQTVGFPLLLIPFIIFITKNKRNRHQQPPITSDQIHYKSLAVIYICIGIIMAVQGRLAAMGKLEIPFGVFTLIYTTQLFFTPIFAAFINKIKFNRWIVISVILAIITGALTLSSAFGGEPDEAEENYGRGAWAALFAGVCFSLVLCNIQNVFDSYIFKRTESTTRKPSFASVFEVLIFSSLVATIISIVGLLIAGEQDDLKREMREFSKGKGSYVMAMVGQAVSWQIYWVGIVGLVFSVSSVLSNVISVITWPILSVLVVIFFNFMDDEFDVFKGIALITAVLSAAAYFFRLHKENRMAKKHVHIPINIEQDPTTLTNQTGNSNQRSIHWPTVILCIIFVITGQSITKLLENFYYNHIQRRDYDAERQNDGGWTQSLLQTVGFPLLLPFIIFTNKSKRSHRQQAPITSSDPSSTILIFSFSGCIGIFLTSHGTHSGQGKLEISFSVFTLIYTIQLFFTPILAAFVNKVKFNRWIIISLILAIVTGAITSSSSSFSGEPEEAEENYALGVREALFSGVFFSILLCVIEYVFKRTESTTRKASFASVFEVIIFSSIFATIISVFGLLIYGEQDNLKREMNGFSEGKGAYVMAMVGQAVSWQVYWVGIVGLVFSVSSVLSNVISVITWPIVSVLVVILFNFMDDEFDVFKCVALITAALSVAAYIYWLRKENRN